MDNEAFEEMPVNPLKGILVFYVNVGQLPPEKAIDFVNKVKNNTNVRRISARLAKQDYEMLWLPIREGQTRMEVMPLI